MWDRSCREEGLKLAYDWIYSWIAKACFLSFSVCSRMSFCVEVVFVPSTRSSSCYCPGLLSVALQQQRLC